MRTNIKILMSEKSDQTVTGAIERYRKMEESAVLDSITQEWPEQMAAILGLYMAVTTSLASQNISHFTRRPRKNGTSDYTDFRLGPRRRP
jgi:flagellar motor switch protein FliG